MKLLLALFGALLLVQVNCDNIDRIYQGWHLSPHEFPWMVKLKVRLFIWIFSAEILSSVVAKHNKESKKHVQYYMVISLMTVID